MLRISSSVDKNCFTNLDMSALSVLSAMVTALLRYAENNANKKTTTKRTHATQHYQFSWGSIALLGCSLIQARMDHTLVEEGVTTHLSLESEDPLECRKMGSVILIY